MIMFALLVFAQIEQALEIANKGATMGGQAILFLGLVLAGYIIRVMHLSNRTQMQSALAAHERQHGELLALLNSERDSSKRERDDNHQSLLRVATESATGLQATATAITGLTAAMGSLRDTLHLTRDDMHARQLRREVDKI